MHMFPIIILAIAVSLDSFGVGVAYGLRGLNPPFSSLVVIGGVLRGANGPCHALRRLDRSYPIPTDFI